MAVAGRCKRSLLVHRWFFLAGLLAWTLSGVGCQDPLFRLEGETKVTDYSQATSLPLPAPVRFYGNKYSELYVSPDGVIGFDKTIHHHHTLNPWQVQEPFIAPFYYMAEKPEHGPETDNYIGSIRFKETTNGTFLQELSALVNDNALGIRHFSANFAVVVTWENVTDFLSVTTGGCQPIHHSPSPCKTSTFQAVLVANADTTAVIFNYAKMDINCSSHCGAGVSGGRSADFLGVLPCRDQNCVFQYTPQLPRTRGTNVTGRFLFLVSETAPSRGGCVDSDVVSQPLLDFYPKAVGMFGGQIIDVTPPCPSSRFSSDVTCKFSDQASVTAFRHSPHATKERCAVPRLTVRGEVLLNISARGQDFQTVQPLTVILPSRHGNTVQPASLGWNETDAPQLALRWHPSMLSQDPQARVDVVLVLYREDAVTGQLIWKDVVLASDIANNIGRFSMTPAEHRCQGDDCKLFELGLMEIRLRRNLLSSAADFSVLHYGPIPLGWWVTGAMTEEHGAAWPAQLCQAWYEKDGQSSSWREELLHCPCSLHQAISDFGRWQPDGGCNMYNGSVCTFHKGAKHCVRSVQPSKPGGHGNQCCYREDGSLLYAADSFQGSTPDRGHDWGAAPYGKPGRVPSLSHWIHDVVTFFYCCLWDGYRSCDKYMDLRATRDCKGYRVPKSAIAYGDPHITTFDGNTYSMSGKGDFWLLESTMGLKVQAKMAVRAAHLNNGGGGMNGAAVTQQANGTQMTAVAMQGPQGPVVLLQLQDPSSTSSGLDVQVGGQRRYFLRSEDFWQDFEGVSVVNNVAVDAPMPLSNFTIIFSCGAGVTVAAVRGLLHVTVVVPPEAKGGTSGLLGTWDDNRDTDFRSRSGVVVAPTASTLLKYKNFSLSWKVNQQESLFPEGSRDAADMDYTPTFPEDLTSVHPAYCQGNVPCNMDAAITGDRNLALASKAAQENFAQFQQFQTLEPNCGWLPVKYSEKTSTNYKLGSKVTITGCRNGEELRGTRDYTCVERGGSAVWDPQVTASCGDAVEEGQSIGMIIGIVVAVVALLVIAAVVAFVLYRRSKSSSTDVKKRDTEKGGSERNFDSVRYEAAASKEKEEP